ncbi:MAG: SMC-Scp complex subunit ScpB [Prochlorotrichaceae cyanobacterium]|jgi:segregation and condensation protein B
MPSLLENRVEAILYLKAKPLTIKEISEYARASLEEVQDALITLMDRYAHQDSALEVLETPKGFVLQLRSEFQDLVHSLIPVDLGVGALRTLAVIALKGSVSQTELVDLRGSGAYQQVQNLVEQGFVGKRRQKDSRSYRLQVTEKFHQYFQIEGSGLEQRLKQLTVPLVLEAQEAEEEETIDELDEEDMDEEDNEGAP